MKMLKNVVKVLIGGLFLLIVGYFFFTEGNL